MPGGKMALQPSSDGCQCQTDNRTDDTWSVTTEPAATRRHVLRAFTYLHVQDEDSGVIRLVAGPCSYTLKQNERVTLGPQPMVVVPSANYCIVESPVVRNDGLVAFDDLAQARLRHGEREVRLHQPPFPLYPGETLACSVQPLPVVAGGQALRLRAVQNTTDNEGTQRKAGDEWLFGPGTYMPRPEISVVGHVDATVVGPNQALRLRAVRDTTDNEGTQRKAGDEWLFGPGTYMLRPEISVVGHVDATVVGANQALRLRAVRDTTDNEGIQHRAGDEWLVKKNGAYIPAIGEEVVEVLELITLTSRQYCIVCIPVVDGKPQHKILQGPQSFFLQPGEVLQDGVRDICFLEANEGLDLVARGAFTDETVTPAVSRSLGERWTVRGPAAVAPPFEADVLRRHSVIPLGPNEGVYVQNTMTGEVRIEMNDSYELTPYLLTAEERLWSKELSPDAERLLAEERCERGTGTSQRDKTRVVTFMLPANMCMLVVSNNGSDSRYGAQLVALRPSCQFRVFSLPGGTPVVLNHSQSLTVPRNYASNHLTDIITVTRENQERCALTVNMSWNCGNSVYGMTKDAVNYAFLRLRKCLLEDVRKNNLKTEYAYGIEFFNIYISDTDVLGLK